MPKGIWGQLNKPIMVMAPMYDVTDTAFRQIINKYGKPDLFFTEFVSADGLCSIAKDKLIRKLLRYSPEEKPIIAQIFGINPENFYNTAKLIIELGFDGIDINFGCPDKNVVKKFAGSGVIRKPELAEELIQATIEGTGGKVPVSVKTRVGYNTNIIEEWAEFLLRQGIDALTIHARTKKEMSKVPANWNLVKTTVEIRNSLNADTVIIGNGDVKNLDEANQRVLETGCDGVMIGRGIFGNPWLFNKTIKKSDLPEEKILQVMLEHTRLFVETFGDEKHFLLMRKHFGSYISGFENASELRAMLMETENLEQVEQIVNNYINKNNK